MIRAFSWRGFDETTTDRDLLTEGFDSLRALPCFEVFWFVWFLGGFFVLWICKQGTEAQHYYPHRMGLSHNLGILHSLFHPQRPRTLCQNYYPSANCRRWIRTIPGLCPDPSLGKPPAGPRLAQCARHRYMLFFGIATTTTIFKQPCGLFIFLSRCYFSFKFCNFPCLRAPQVCRQQPSRDLECRQHLFEQCPTDFCRGKPTTASGCRAKLLDVPAEVSLWSERHD